MRIVTESAASSVSKGESCIGNYILLLVPEYSIAGSKLYRSASLTASVTGVFTNAKQKVERDETHVAEGLTFR